MAILIPRKKEFWLRKPATPVDLNSNDLNDDLVGAWLLGSSNERDLTENTNTYEKRSATNEYSANDKFGEGLSFGGTSSELYLGTIEASNPLACLDNGEFSLLSIVDYESVDFRRIFSISSSSGYGEDGFELVTIGTDSFRLAVDRSYVSFSSNTRLNKSIIGVTHDQSNAYLYTDGSFVESKAFTSTIAQLATPEVRIGNRNTLGRNYDSPIWLQYVFNKMLASDEMLSLQEAPYQLVKQRGTQFYFIQTSAGNAVNATADALALTEYQATVSLDRNISAGVDALTLTEYAATVEINTGLNVNATVDSITLTEYQATVSIDKNVSATTDALTLTEYPATVVQGLNIEATVFSISLTEYAAVITRNKNISAGLDALTLTEYSATVATSTSITATTDALTLTEYQATIQVTVNVSAGVDSLIITEYPATVISPKAITATTDSLLLTEYRASVSTGVVVPGVNNGPLFKVYDWASQVKRVEPIKPKHDTYPFTGNRFPVDDDYNPYE